MHYKTFFLITISIIIVLTSCKKEEISITTERTMYNFPDNKLWAHRVNTALEANGLLKNFNGIETDVFFMDDLNEFQTGHDSPSGFTLESFFDSINNCSNYYYWIDYKNLSEANVQSSLTEIKRLIKKNHLEGRIIIESSNPDQLAQFRCEEIFTSYWIEELDVFISYFAERKLASTIQSKIEQYHFDALSCCYEMNDFFQQYFKNYNVHLWTNDLTGKSGIKDIEQLATYQNVKVILVDYDRNFIQKPGQHTIH